MKTDNNLQNNQGVKSKNVLVFALLGIIAVLLIFILCNSLSKDSEKAANNNYQSGNANTNTNTNSNSNSNSSYSNDNNNTSNNNEIKVDDNISKNKIYDFDEPFIFDDLEIVINSNYAFDVVKNRFSDYNNHTVLKLPVTVKNISSETHGLNMFYYTCYGSNGTEAKELGSYFDDNIDHAGDLRSGASYTKYMYFEYDGDGTYALEFDNYSSKITVEFKIKKG